MNARGATRRWLLFVFVVVCGALPGCGSYDGPPKQGAPSMTQRPLSEVLSSHTQELMAIPGVVGTGQTESDGRPAFLVIVQTKSNEMMKRIPRSIEGYVVVIREAGEVRALGDGP